MPTDISGQMNLQSTIAAATAANHEGVAVVLPHHPITCGAGLYYDEEGVLSCDHAKTERGNPRTQSALNHSMAILILEFAATL